MQARSELLVGKRHAFRWELMLKARSNFLSKRVIWNGGADRDRTCDLLIANETLYQLSYDPIPPRFLRALLHIRFCFGFTLRGEPKCQNRLSKEQQSTRKNTVAGM